jgi:hypothetical protein
VVAGGADPSRLVVLVRSGRTDDEVGGVDRTVVRGAHAVKLGDEPGARVGHVESSVMPGEVDPVEVDCRRSHAMQHEPEALPPNSG